MLLVLGAICLCSAQCTDDNDATSKGAKLAADAVEDAAGGESDADLSDSGTTTGDAAADVSSTTDAGDTAASNCPVPAGFDRCIDASKLVKGQHGAALQSALDLGGRTRLFGVFELVDDDVLLVGRVDDSGKAHDAELVGSAPALTPDTTSDAHYDAKGFWAPDGGSHRKTWPTRFVGGGVKTGKLITSHLSEQDAPVNPPKFASVKLVMRNLQVHRPTGMGVLLTKSAGSTFDEFSITDVLPSPIKGIPDPALAFALQIGVSGMSELPATPITGKHLIRKTTIDLNTKMDPAILNYHQGGITIMRTNADVVIEDSAVLHGEYFGIACGPIFKPPKPGDPVLKSSCTIRRNFIDTGPPQLGPKALADGKSAVWNAGSGMMLALGSNHVTLVNDNIIRSAIPSAIGINEGWGMNLGNAKLLIEGNTIEVPNAGIRLGVHMLNISIFSRPNMRVANNVIKAKSASIEVFAATGLIIEDNNLTGAINLHGVSKSRVSDNVISVTGGCLDVDVWFAPGGCKSKQDNGLCGVPAGCYCDLADCQFVNAAIAERPYSPFTKLVSGLNLFKENTITGTAEHGISLGGGSGTFKFTKDGKLYTWAPSLGSKVFDNDLSGLLATKAALHTAARSGQARFADNKLGVQGMASISGHGEANRFEHCVWPPAAASETSGRVAFAGKKLVLVEGGETILKDETSGKNLLPGKAGGPVVTWSDVGTDNVWKVQ